MKKQLPGWAVLLIITLAAGLALGGTYALTKDPIAQQALAAAESARKAALPDADSFEELTLGEDAAVDWAYAGFKDGTAVGYVAQKTVNGFGGKVEVIAGVDTKNAPNTFTVSGVSVGGSSFSETAGLGARAKEPAFTGQFAGKVYQLKLIKAGDEAGDNTVDALTSATITSTAVVNGVNDIVKYIKSDVMGIAGVEMPQKPASGVYSASAQGFRGPVYVEAAFDAANTVTYISVGDESFAEDIGAGAVEPEFMIQFIGKTAPVELGDVDALSGATITTKAVISALNDAATLAGGGELPAVVEIVMPEKPEEGVFSASEQGFAGPVYVEAAFDENGKITYISVGDDHFAETEGFGARALEADSQYPFIGAQLPLEIGDVDTLTGATFTKTAIVNGLNKAYAASKGEVIEEPVKEEVKLPEKPEEGVFSASEQGFAGPVYVEAAFDESGKITYISVGDDNFAETEGFGARALEADSQLPFIGAQLPLEIGDVDTLTGATFTKTAIVNGLNKAFAASKGEGAEEPAKEEAVMPEKPETTFGAAAMGFESDVYVEAAFEDGKVTWLSIGDKRFAETEGLGAKALEPAFALQFLGKNVPLTIDDIDAITGATYTTKAVVEALNKAYSKYQEAAAAPAAEPTKPETTYTASEQGFAGPVYVEAAFDESGKITYISVGDDNFAETAGFGARALEEDSQLPFIGAQMPLELGDVDTLAGATFTKTAIVNGLNKAYAASKDEGAEEPAKEEPTKEEEKLSEKPAEGVFSASEQGFAGPVYVEAAFDESGKITYISVGDDNFAETAGFGARALEEESQLPFIGAQMPLELGDVDALTGATFTKTAIVNGLNKAFAASKGEGVEEPAKEEPTKEEEKLSEKPAEGVFSASEQGFAGPVYVEAAFDESGKITYISVGDDSFAETAGFGARALEEDSQLPFIGAQMPLELGDVDTLTGATFTKTAIMNGLNKAFAASKGEGAEEPAKEEAVMPEKPETTFGAAAMGFESDVYVEAAFEDGKVTWLSIGDKRFAETEGLGAKALEPAFALQFLGKSVPLTIDDIDAITGATYTTKAVVLALNEAYEKSVAALPQ